MTPLERIQRIEQLRITQLQAAKTIGLKQQELDRLKGTIKRLGNVIDHDSFNLARLGNELDDLLVDAMDAMSHESYQDFIDKLAGWQ